MSISTSPPLPVICGLCESFITPYIFVPAGIEAYFLKTASVVVKDTFAPSADQYEIFLF